MSRVEDYHYRVSDSRNVTQEYFATEGLAHQYLQEEFPTLENVNQGGYGNHATKNVMSSVMFVKRVKRKH